MSAAAISTRVPQKGDGIAALLAQLAPSPKSGYALARALRSVTTTSADIDAAGYDTLIVRLNIVAFGGGAGVIPIVQSVDPESGVVTALASASGSLTGTGWWVYVIGRGIGTFSGMGTGVQGYASVPLTSLIRMGLHWSSFNWHEVEVTYELTP